MKKSIVYIGIILFTFFLIPTVADALTACACIEKPKIQSFYAGCEADKAACKAACQKEAGKKGIASYIPVVSDCAKGCVVGTGDLGGGIIVPAAGCGVCAENPSIQSCKEIAADSTSDEDKKYADTPEIVLEIPVGKEGTAASPVVGLSGYISILYEYIVILVALAAVVMIMFGGFKWATAAGNASQVGAAKTTIINAIIGLVLALTSFLLLYTINPALVSLDTFKIPYVKLSDDAGSVDCNPPSTPLTGDAGRTAITTLAKAWVDNLEITYSNQRPSEGGPCQDDGKHPAGDTCFDCSGFVSHVIYCATGIKIQTSTLAMSTWSGGTNFEKVSGYSAMKPGGFYGYSASPMGHTVLYMSNGKSCEVRGSSKVGGAGVCRSETLSSKSTFFFNLK